MLKHLACLLVLTLGLACDSGEQPSACVPTPYVNDAQDPYPKAHFTPLENWMNDPNGLIELDDGLHLFFQHNPSGPLWGNIHWGHARTDDFTRYEDLGLALFPDDTLGEPFSGSAYLDTDGRGGVCQAPCLVLAFTHAGGVDSMQKQSLAFSEDGGRTFDLFAGNPIVANPGGTPDFRDPKVFFHEPTDAFVMVVDAGDRAHIYTAPDLVHWTKASEIGPFDDMPDGAWEVPELFEIDGRWVFKTDVLPGLLQQGEGRYLLGDFDGSTFTPTGELTSIDGGPDFYAAQVIANQDEPRWMAWLSSWAYAFFQPTEPFVGQLSVPRRLALRGDRLVQTPDLFGLEDPCPLVDKDSPAGDDFAGIEADAFVLRVRGDAMFRVHVGEDEFLELGLLDGTLVVDRTKGRAISEGFSGCFTRDAPNAEGFVAVVDRFSAELFGDGEVITASAFQGSNSRGIQLVAGTPAHVTLRRLRREPRVVP